VPVTPFNVPFAPLEDNPFALPKPLVESIVVALLFIAIEVINPFVKMVFVAAGVVVVGVAAMYPL